MFEKTDPASGKLAMFCKTALLIATLALASVTPGSASEAKTTGAIRTLADVFRDAHTKGNWKSAYAELEGYLASIPKGKDWKMDEYEFLGLSRHEVGKICSSLGYWPDAKTENASFGCGQGGSGFGFKYKNDKVVAVHDSSYSGDSVSNGPWITSKTEGLRRAELKTCSEIESCLKGPDRDSEKLVDLYRYRATLRRALGEDEYATRDLFEICILLKEDAANTTPGTGEKKVEPQTNNSTVK